MMAKKNVLFTQAYISDTIQKTPVIRDWWNLRFEWRLKISNTLKDLHLDGCISFVKLQKGHGESDVFHKLALNESYCNRG